MLFALEFEALLCELLHKYTKLEIYNHVPDDAVTPFIRIGEISVESWLLAPPSARIGLTLAIFSEEQSNRQVIEIADVVEMVLAQNLIRRNFPNIIQISQVATRVFQLKNLSWCAEIELSMRYYKK